MAPAGMPTNPGASPKARRGPLDWIEWVGNKLPEPALLFALLCVGLAGAAGGSAAWLPALPSNSARHMLSDVRWGRLGMKIS